MVALSETMNRQAVSGLLTATPAEELYRRVHRFHVSYDEKIKLFNRIAHFPYNDFLYQTYDDLEED